MNGYLTPAMIARASSLNELIALSGIDPADQMGVNRVMAEFNALPFKVRKRLTDRDTTLPAVPPLTAAQRNALARQSRWFAIATLLTEFFADGRPMTERGNPKLADCITLSELLGTRDISRSKPRSMLDMPYLDWIISMSVHLGVLEVHGRRLRASNEWATEMTNRPYETYRAAIAKVCETAVLEKDGTGFDFFNWIDRYLNLNTVRICANLYRHGKGRRDDLGGYAFRQLAVPATQESLDMMNRANLPDLLDMRFSRFLWCLTSLGLVTGPPVDHIPDESNFTVEVSALGAVALERQFRLADFNFI